MVVVMLSFMVLAKPESANAEEITDLSMQNDEYVDATDILVIDADDGGATPASSPNSVFRFELEKPAYVDVGAYISDGYADVIVSKDAAGNRPVHGGAMNITSNDNDKMKVYLEKGTYYVVFKHKRDSVGVENSASVIAQYVDRTVTNNSSIKNAKKVDIKQPIIGFLSDSVRSQYYQFNINAKSKVEVNLLFDAVFGDYSKSSRPVVVKANIYDKNYKVVSTVELGENAKNTALNMTKTLEKGTYYLGFEEISGTSLYDGSDVLVHFGETFINIKATKVSLTAPKVTSYKTKAKSVSGTAAAGSEVFVICNNDVFYVTADSKGAFKANTTALVKGKNVKVFAIKDGVKSKATTVKVK